MKKRNSLYTLFALVMVFFMAIAFMPANTYAAEDEDPGVYVSKEAHVHEDGTYDIELEAYSTGEVKTEEKVVPCDIVLVLDLSGSMAQSFGNTTRIRALVDAVNSFQTVVAQKNAENAAVGADLSQVAIVGYSGSNYTANILDWREVTNSNLASSKVRTSNYGPSGAIQIGTHDWTYTHNGMERANTLLQNRVNSSGYSMTDRARVVVLFTDGYPASTNGMYNFNRTFAKNAVTYAGTAKSTYQASVFSVALLDDARPAVNPVNASRTDYPNPPSGAPANGALWVNQMLHAISSNYPQATASDANNNFTVTWGNGDYTKGFYKSATSAEELESIFKDIAESSASTSTPLTAEAVMKDIVSSSFTLTEGVTINDINVNIIPWDQTNHRWSETTKYTSAQWKTACRNYGAQADENISITIREDGKTIDVTGFDYHTHFLATNDPILDVNGINKNSAKINIDFPIQAHPSAITGTEVNTNDPESGIYIDGNAEKPLIPFPQPKVTFKPVTYVVDYVTSDTSHDTKASTVKLDYSGVLKNVDRLDDPSDDVLIGEEASAFDYTIYKGKYGTISFGDDEVDVQRRYVRYAPTTMNWNGYDRIFIKGASQTESDLDVWAMLCVIPANSVFYEDTYITQTKTVHYNEGDVNIEYTGIAYDEGKWGTVGTEGKNQTMHAGDEMGWVDGLADDSTYANDMAHKSDTPKAKATFTFSGTGVDIYSRTNGSTGTATIRVQSVKPDPTTGKKFSKLQIIDTKAAAGDFFAIPVCTFTDLPYDEYTVTITVTAAAQNEERYTFYLDGVRVYNPIQPLEGDEIVQTMYTEKHLGAVFTEVRSMLLDDPDKAEASALYIDEHYTTEEVPDVKAIEAAAAVLSEAQKRRDQYVEGTITIAKNAVSEEQYNKDIAEENVVTAQTVYDFAEEAYNNAYDAWEADPTTENEAAMNKAKATMEAKAGELEVAKSERDEAVAHYNANIGALQDALQAAIDGKATYDSAVDKARADYDTAAGDTLEIETTTQDIEVYRKDGPNHEVLLDKDEYVTITVEPGKFYYIGLRSLNGNKVTAELNGKKVDLSHTVDLYYEVEPVDNTIVVKNTTDNVLSVTKLRASGAGNTKNGLRIASTEETLNFVRNMAKQSVSDYNGEILTEDEANAGTPAVEEETETTIDEGDIAIDNPEPETEKETETTKPGSSAAGNWVKLLSSFSKFFKR